MFIGMHGAQRGKLKDLISHFNLFWWVFLAMRSLDHYDEIETLSNSANHRILKAKFNGNDCVLVNDCQ